MNVLATLVLRDVHLPAAPGWWPLPPGWWIVLGGVALLAAAFVAWRTHRRRQWRRWQAVFDAGTAAVDGAGAQIAASAELLRRAARVRQPGAELLQDEAWLRFLDTPGSATFSQGEGRLLLDGGYRRTLDPAAAARVRDLARERFVQLMTGRPR